MKNLLIGAGPSVTGTWTHFEPMKDVDFPVGVWFVSHTWAAGNVILETLVGGLPGNGASSPIPPQNDTGSVVVHSTNLYSGPVYVLITIPFDYLRARTDSSVTGTVDVFAAEQS